MKKLNPELKGIAAILLIALVIGVLLAGTTGKLEQWGLPWFTGARAVDRIIFVSDRSGSAQVYSMDVDGSDQKQLTTGDVEVLSAPTISPAGNRIAFVGMKGSSTQVFAVGANGGSLRAITTSASSKRQPAYSPNAKRLAYIESGRVFVAELSGANPEPVLPTDEELALAMNDPSGGRGVIPMYSMFAWGPDGESLAGVTSQNGVQALVYLPSPDGEAQRFSLGDPTAKVVGLSWAVDTPLLAASIQVGESRGMVVLFDPEQPQPQVVFTGAVRVGAPAISPDGIAIVVPAVSKDVAANAPHLLKIDLEAAESSILCKGVFENPVYPPGGDSILATLTDSKTRKRGIVTIDPESGEVTRLAGKGNNFDAIWSPQSR